MISFPVLAHLLSEHFGIEKSELRPEATFEELEMDSLALVELAVIVEDKLGVRLPDNIDGLGLSATLAEAVEFLERAARPVAPPEPAPAVGERGPVGETGSRSGS
ncbi:phosphopantetheine-binding protein [Streptomyces sp. UNOC14_S4]|uniref:phosphopantetheine-binding protein n=1 Tax=Streptomyces sp. UNOC14_S4 TaxID=2872340 RepID=UPI001E3DC08B|nr:phosphopantetheine-binding protein [Streptomyces sp. UNOC14_S4]MCC3766192.1 acyl carrier protein [Streptomyces sp. UNOC14_S4]